MVDLKSGIALYEVQWVLSRHVQDSLVPSQGGRPPLEALNLPPLLGRTIDAQTRSSRCNEGCELIPSDKISQHDKKRHAHMEHTWGVCTSQRFTRLRVFTTVRSA